MPRKLALYSSSFSPPGIHQVNLVERLAREFDEVVVVPSGPRPDKPQTEVVDPIYRATMVDMAFGQMENVRVKLFDLEQATFSRTDELQKRCERDGEVWHVVTSDMIDGGARGESIVHQKWAGGQDLWYKLNFAVATREGSNLDEQDLPPKHIVVDARVDGSGQIIREKLFHQSPYESLVPPRIASYIHRHRLYRGSIPAKASLQTFDDPRLLICAAEENEQANQWAKRFEKYRCDEDPNLILVLGGDGTMLHAIQTHWRRRLPWLGLNAGHFGFLLNDKEVLESGFPPRQAVLRQMPMLYCEARAPGSNQWEACLSFNDVWVERSTGQSAWLEVKVNDRIRFQKLMCDGVLLSTAAGSTAYAYSMGATPLLADTPAWLLVGNNVMDPRNWKSALLPLESTVEINVLDSHKRPVKGYSCSDPLGDIATMRARVSRIAAVELAFYPQHDMAEKIASMQFPQT